MASDYEQRIMRVLKYIHDNPDGDLSLDALADVAAMSRFHWHRVFHAMTGETCAQAVRRLRLFRAARWLLYKDWTIAEIAKKVGYPNVNSFSRAFQEEYGMPPGRFRAKGCLGPLRSNIVKGEYKMFNVEIRQTPARRLAAISHKGPYTEIGGVFEKLFSYEQQFDGEVKGIVGVYYDDPNMVAEKDLRSRACAWIDEESEIPNGLEEMNLPEGKYAVLTYKGPYKDIKVAYDHLFGHWLPKSGHEPAHAPSHELYLNMPQDTKPEDLLTEIHLPLSG